MSAESQCSSASIHNMNHCVEPELLDALPPEDAAARRSRQDLSRLNSLMQHGRIVAQALTAACARCPPQRIVDLGAGDGSFMLGLARELAWRWQTVDVVLVDRQKILQEATRWGFRELGWNCEPVQADAFDWLTHSELCSSDCIVANLFLHHFAEPGLRRLLMLAAARVSSFVACEPRRTPAVLTASRCLGLIGCNRVTRHDAIVSVRAGFLDHELSRLWPSVREWKVVEREAGLFSHLFVATRATCGQGPTPLPQ